VIAQFNLLAAENSMDGVQILPVTEDNIHFEHNDERGRD